MLTTNIFQPDKPIKMEAKDEQQKHGSERNLSERDNSPSLHDYDNNDADDNNDASSLLSYSDVESFQGKIVYNPDGIAYIIDSENETSYSANDNLQMSSNNPRIHSFRVVSARDADAPNSKNQEQSSSSSSQENNNRQHKLEKPVLMCFICKLSFGNTKTFQLHAHSEHTLNLIESEKLLLSREYSSAIIQRNIDEKPQISFLEPLMDPRLNPIRKLSPNPESQNASSPTKMSSNNSTSNPDLSNIDASFMNMMNRMNGNGQATNLSTKFGSNSALNQLTSSPSPKISDNAQCPDHYGMKEMFDCKKCEININANLSDKSPNPLSQCSPSIHSNAASPASSGLNISPTAPSFTIGACPEHINGRPIGIECARCEMVLNTVRLNSGVQMSTRNSCKTLKCPQCNWHYKYQETLEIHMREKHPDGASACGYCLAGQQHPRLARGESYTCGYKPYRCEICNYSTTTKGNLSIHMQSDKHLNNMQELNNTQNNLVITSSAGSICNYPAVAKETSPVHQQNEKLLTNLQELNNSQNNMVTTLSATSIQNYLTPTKSSLPLHAKPENLMSNAPELNNSHNNVKPSPSATATSPDENTIRETAKIMLANMHSQATSTSRDENNLRETSKLLFGNMHAQPPTATPLADLGMRDSSKIMLTNMLAQATTASQQSYGGIRETSQMMLINIHLQAVQQQQCMVDVAQQLLAAISGVTKIVQQQPKPRPCFRCDVCSYETSVARNLRIHLTSEKHTHIMTVLQNNIKHLQALSFLQSFSIGIGQTRNQFAELQNFLLEAVLADIAYNEALNIQLLHQNSPASPQPPPRTPSSAEDYGNCQNQSSSPPSPQPPPRTPSHAEDYGNGNNDNSPPSPEPPQRSSSVAEDYSGRQNDIDPPPTESDVRPTTYFSCLVCQTFDTNNIDELNMHLLIDRARNNTLNDVMLVVNNNYICSLCNYETNLKANFQLHTKTDKHILKLSHINHIREGGPKNEYKIRALIQSERKNSNRNSNQNDKLLNTVQLKCNCCDYYTNSIQKLNIHATSLRHENMKVMFDMWTNWINQ